MRKRRGGWPQKTPEDAKRKSGVPLWVTSTAAPNATGWSDKLPGGTFTRDFHPLKTQSPFHGAPEREGYDKSRASHVRA